MDQAQYETFKSMLRGGGIQAMQVNQLFQTPAALAMRMTQLADIRPGDWVLEPSAGMGAILNQLDWRIMGGTVTAVEIDHSLINLLRARFPHAFVHEADFLEIAPRLGTFDRIIMNPAFINGQDIKHIKKAAGLLNPGGRLVAICADGPRQRDQLGSWATTYETLPPGTFKDSGTMVSAALLTYDCQ